MMVAYTAYNHQILQSLLLQLLHCVLNGEEVSAYLAMLYHVSKLYIRFIACPMYFK